MSSRRGGDQGSKVTLPITPMLDMTFQLLFFFIMSFNPSPIEGQMDMSLPADAEAVAKDQKDVKKDSKTDKVPDDFPSDLTVKVRTRIDGTNDGEISALSVSAMGGTEQPMDDIAALKRYLTTKREGLTNKESLKLQGDGKLKVRHIMAVMDACRQCGFVNISMVPPEDLGR
jgi:biopolymer transport protein ExbD